VPYPQVDLVVHLAANAKVHELVQFPHRAMENIALTFNVLEYCRHNRVPLIFSSSREVYGDIHRYITEEQHADFSFTESPYSASKVAGEALVYSYARCYGVRYIVFRFSNVYGRYDNDIERMERVIPLFIQRMRQGLPVTVYGSEKMLDFTYVDDCVEALLLAAATSAADGQIFNLGSDETINLRDLAALLIEINGGGSYEIIPYPADRKPIDIGDYYADYRLIQGRLGWRPKISLRDGLRRTLEFYRAEREHYW
jgi:UDP-glucose 4-epimerase